MFDINGKVAVVTGGANGIGLATVKAILAKGGHPIIADYNEEAGKREAEALGVPFYKIDISDEEKVKEMFEDKTLTCKECGAEFVFTASEQEFYESKGFVNEPQRCKACRDARKQAARGPRELHEATCANCGGVAKVPFVPRDDRPVYCSECFAKMKEENA